MNTKQLLDVLQHDSFTRTVFQSVVPADNLPRRILKRPQGFIVNTDDSTKKGSHWVAMYFTQDGKAEFFDSYGQDPDFYSQGFETFLQNNSMTFAWTKRVLQSPWSRVCGHYCLFYALHRCRNMPTDLRIGMIYL